MPALRCGGTVAPALASSTSSSCSSPSGLLIVAPSEEEVGGGRKHHHLAQTRSSGARTACRNCIRLLETRNAAARRIFVQTAFRCNRARLRICLETRTQRAHRRALLTICAAQQSKVQPSAQRRASGRAIDSPIGTRTHAPTSPLRVPPTVLIWFAKSPGRDRRHEASRVRARCLASALHHPGAIANQRAAARDQDGVKNRRGREPCRNS